MDGYQKIAKLAIVVSVCLHFQACSVEQPLGVHLFQPEPADSIRTNLMTDIPATGPAATGPAATNSATTNSATTDLAITGPAATNSATTNSVTTNSATTDLAITGPDATNSATTDTVLADSVLTYPALIDSAVTYVAVKDSAVSDHSDLASISLFLEPPASSEIRSMEHTPGLENKDVSVDTIVHSETGLKKDSVGYGAITSGTAISETNARNTATSPKLQITADQDTIVPDSMQSFASDLLYYDSPDTLQTAAPESLQFISENRLPPSDPDTPETRETNSEVLVMPAKDVNAIIRSLAGEIETHFRELQQQGQKNSTMLKTLETELKVLRNEIDKQFDPRSKEINTYAFVGAADGLSQDANLQPERKDSMNMTRDSMDLIGPDNKALRIQAGGSSDMSADADSLAGPPAMVSLQLKHYEEVRILQDSLQQLERKNAQLFKQVKLLNEEPAGVVPEQFSDTVYLDRMDAMRSDFERILNDKADSIDMLQKEISGLERDVVEETSFVVYYESSSLTGNNMELFESKMDNLPLPDITAVYLSAFADQSGTAEANFYISEQRLNVLTKELTDRGISPLKIYRQNHGEAFASQDADPTDRRVEILFKY